MYTFNTRWFLYVAVVGGAYVRLCVCCAVHIHHMHFELFPVWGETQWVSRAQTHNFYRFSREHLEHAGTREQRAKNMCVYHREWQQWHGTTIIVRQRKISALMVDVYLLMMNELKLARKAKKRAVNCERRIEEEKKVVQAKQPIAANNRKKNRRERKNGFKLRARGEQQKNHSALSDTHHLYIIGA